MSSDPVMSSMDSSKPQNQFYVDPNVAYQQYPGCTQLYGSGNVYGNQIYEPQYQPQCTRIPFNNITGEPSGHMGGPSGQMVGPSGHISNPSGHISGPSGHMSMPLQQNTLGCQNEIGFYDNENMPKAMMRPYYQEAIIQPPVELPRNAEDRIMQGDCSFSVSKRFRTVFTDVQKNTLRREFGVNMFLDQQRRRNIASMLNLSEKTVKVWFQNRRMEIQRQKKNKILFASNDGRDSNMCQASSTLLCEDGTYSNSSGYQTV